MMSNDSKFVCDWCGEPAEYNKGIYYACDDDEEDLTRLVNL